MCKILVLIILLIAACKTPSAWGQQAPKKLPWNAWADRLITGYLINMTREITKDATYKLRQAEQIKDRHSHSITYELGFIAAGIQERFQRMLKIYRQYADINAFRGEWQNIPQLLNAYHVMQGDYNEIRLEKGIFHDIVRRHETTPSTNKYRIPKHFLDMMDTPKGIKRLKWSPNDEYESFD